MSVPDIVHQAAAILGMKVTEDIGNWDVFDPIGEKIATIYPNRHQTTNALAVFLGISKALEVINEQEVM